MRKYLRLAGLLIAMGCCASSGHADGCPDAAKHLGTSLGKAFIREAEALGKATIRADEGDVYCDDDFDTQANTPSPRAVCVAEKHVVDVLEKIDEAEEKGCLDSNPAYAESHAYFLFQTLLAGLNNDDSIVRWNVLERIKWLCEWKTLLPDSADSACIEEVESGCLKVLAEDHDPNNREHALKTLAAGFVTRKSEAVLVKIAEHGEAAGERMLAAEALEELRKGNAPP